MEHVSTYLAPIFNRCPVCGARPLQPCQTLGRNPVAVRYAHAERNRT